MRIMQNFSVSSVAFFAASFIASSVLAASSFVVELIVLPVRLFSRALCFGVLRSSLLCSSLHHAQPAFSCDSFSPFCWQRFVAVLSSNFTLMRKLQKRVAP